MQPGCARDFQHERGGGVQTLGDLASAQLDRLGIAGYQTGSGPVFISKNAMRLASPETQAAIKKAGRRAMNTTACTSCIAYHGSLGTGLAGAELMSLGYGELQGTGYDPFSGNFVDGWSDTFAISSVGYQGELSAGGINTIGPLYLATIPLTPAQNCAFSAAALFTAATTAASAIANNASTFANAYIKVGVTSIAATTFAGIFIAAGAEATGIAGCLALLACLTLPEWAALGLTVGVIAAVAWAATQCR